MLPFGDGRASMSSVRAYLELSSELMMMLLDCWTSRGGCQCFA